jgi:mannose-1-phosphate guanylyltransferase
MRDFYAVIMAGGSGTRLWPLSRQHQPKQALQLVGDRTMLQHATDRLATLLPMDHVLVVTADSYVPTLAAQVPEIPAGNFIVEPIARGTAGAVGLAALHLRQRDPDAVMAVLTADHYIRAVDVFRRALAAACQVAREGRIATLGIRPSYGATGFGYIRRGERLDTVGEFQVYRVDAFVEKPDAERAAQFVASNLYTWNSGMFIWHVTRIMDEFARHMPGFHAQMQRIGGALGTPDYEDTLSAVWPAVRKETIDYGIMEKAQDVVVIPVDIGWTDIGDWGALYRLLSVGEGDNVVDSNHIGVGTSGCLVKGDKKLIATIGLQDTIVIDTDDAILICARERAQDVRMVVELLQGNGKTEYL